MTELRQRAGDQPLPTPNEHTSIQALVRADLDAREHLGIRRYGTPLQPHNGRDAMRDLYEELLDAACYARQVIEETDRSAAHEIARLQAAVVERDATIQRREDLVAELRRHVTSLERRLEQDPSP